jgi:tRNA (cytidine/uridine-2'-O-)-methyltransferase
MFHIALFEPEIPPNTGNIMRQCANTGCSLALIHPLGFQMDAKKLKRAGMDYRDLAVVREHDNYVEFLATLATNPAPKIYALTTKARTVYSDAHFQAGDVFLFGPETRGLPQAILDSLPEEQKLRVPMMPDSRSINLANTVAIVAYEAFRQQGFRNLY